MFKLESGNTFKYTCFTIFTSVSLYTTTSVAIYTICARSAVFTWIRITLINICRCETENVMIEYLFIFNFNVFNKCRNFFI